MQVLNGWSIVRSGSTMTVSGVDQDTQRVVIFTKVRLVYIAKSGVLLADRKDGSDPVVLAV